MDVIPDNLDPEILAKLQKEVNNGEDDEFNF